MYYKVQECFKMIEASDNKFDLVIRIRPDKEIVSVSNQLNWHNVLKTSHQKNRIYSDLRKNPSINPLVGIVMGDQFGVGSYDIMQKYSYTYNNHLDNYNQKVFNWPRKLRGHVSFSNNIFYQGYNVKSLDCIEFGSLLDTEKISNKILKKLIMDDITTRDTITTDQLFLSIF